MDDPHVLNIKSMDLPMDDLINNPAGNPTSSIGITDGTSKNPWIMYGYWMILQIFPEIQGHPYPLQTQNPV